MSKGADRGFFLLPPYLARADLGQPLERFLPSSAAATHQRGELHGLARVTHEERGHRRRGKRRRWHGGGEERCGAVAVERERE
jgi:hypothetical protein